MDDGDLEGEVQQQLWKNNRYHRLEDLIPTSFQDKFGTILIELGQCCGFLHVLVFDEALQTPGPETQESANALSRQAASDMGKEETAFAKHSLDVYGRCCSL